MAIPHARPGDDLASRATASPELNLQVEHERINRGLLAVPERHALHWLAERTPARIKPDHLTVLGVAGAALVMVGFMCAYISPWFVGVVILGLLINWYGDSLDGTLARYRQIERPQFGYFIDHSCDLISQTFIFLGLGLSPFFTLRSALLALSMYLLMSSYTYLKVMILRTHQLSYGGMGATELRVALACWGLIAIWADLDLTGTLMWHYPVLDEAIGAMWVVVFLGFIGMVRSDLSRFRHHLDQHGDVASHAGEPTRPMPGEFCAVADRSRAQAGSEMGDPAGPPWQVAGNGRTSAAGSEPGRPVRPADTSPGPR